MPVYRHIQNSFVSGELSDSIEARTDLAKRTSGATQLTNFMVQPHGGVSNRPGQTYIGRSLGYSRLVPFTYSVVQTYVLEFSENRIRVIKDSGLIIEPIVLSGTYEWQLSASGTSEYYLTGPSAVDPDMLEPTENVLEDGSELSEGTLGSLSAGEWAYGDNDSLGFSTIYVRLSDSTDPSTKADSYLDTILQIETSYTEDDLYDLNFDQSADTLFIVHPDHAPATLTRSTHYTWTLENISFASSISTPATPSLTSIGSWTAGSFRLRYKIAAVNEEGEESLPSDYVGRTYDGKWVAGAGIEITWTFDTDMDSYNVYKYESGYYGFVANVREGYFLDSNYTPDVDDGPKTGRDPFDGTDKYPGAVGLYQQRLIYGRTNNNPQTVWTSQTGALYNMDVSSPLKDDDAITATIASRQVNEIQFFVPLAKMIVFTAGAEWILSSGSTDNALTPTAVAFDNQGYTGSAKVPPIVIGSSAIYVQRGGRTVRDLYYTLETDSYIGSDLTVLVPHLFKDYGIKTWAYQQNPDSIIWVVREDGTLLSFTYMKEHQIWAWATHDTKGEYESVATISSAGRSDEVYFVVKRYINGSYVRYIEVATDRLPYGDVEKAFFVDAGLSLDSPYDIEGITAAEPPVVTSTAHGLSNGDYVDIREVEGYEDSDGESVVNLKQFKVANVTANTFELVDRYTSADIDGSSATAYISGGVWRKAVTSISGLNHLEGEAVDVVANGNYITGKTVTSGTIALDHPASQVHVGLAYTAELKTLPISLDASSGTLSGLRHKLNRVYIKVADTRDIKAGTSEDSLVENKDRNTFADYGFTPLITDVVPLNMKSTFKREHYVYIKHDTPLPITILSIVSELEVGSE